MAIKTRTFSDLDLNFTAHPVTGDITLKYDESAIKTSIKHLVLTSFYERPFHPEIGSNVKALLFENNSPMIGPTLERVIRQVIENYEPRVALISVKVLDSADTNSIYVTVDFRIVNTFTPIRVNVTLERTR